MSDFTSNVCIRCPSVIEFLDYEDNPEDSKEPYLVYEDTGLFKDILRIYSNKTFERIMWLGAGFMESGYIDDDWQLVVTKKEVGAPVLYKTEVDTRFRLAPRFCIKQEISQNK